MKAKEMKRKRRFKKLNHWIFVSIGVWMIFCLTGPLGLGNPAASDSQEQIKKYPLPDDYVAFSLKVAEKIIQEVDPEKNYRALYPEVYNLGGINHILGLVYDQETKDLILVGKYVPERPPLTLDDFKVMLDARFIHRQWPLVSIDPTEETKETGMQQVRFEGGIENTQAGKNLFEGDYDLKKMAMGFLDPGIPNFKSYWDLWNELIMNELREVGQVKEGKIIIKPEQAKKRKIGSRFWFYPIIPRIVVREGVAEIKGLKVGVFTEVLYAEFDGKPVEDLTTFRDQIGDTFAEAVSKRFEELSRVHSSFARIQGLEEMIGLSRSIELLEEKPNLSYWLEDYPLRRVETKKEIKVLRRSSFPLPYELSGGVQLTAVALRLKAGDVSALREAVLSTRPKKDSLSWSFLVKEWVIPTSPEVLKEVLKLKDVSKLFAHALFLEDHKRYDDAITVYDQILELKPDYAEAWCNKGTVLNNLGRYEEALKCCDDALEINPQDTRAWTIKGVALSALGRREEAVKCFERVAEKGVPFYVLELKPEYLLKLGRYEEALQCYDRALEINPKDTEAQSGRGVALLRLGRYQEALKCFDYVIEMNPQWAGAWSNKGAALCQLGRHVEALKCCDRALEIDPECDAAWLNRGIVLEELERLQEALKCYDRALEINPQNALAWTKKGRAIEMLGSFQEGLECHERALKIDPQLAEAQTNKRKTLRNLRSCEVLLKGSFLKNPDALYLVSQGFVLARAGRVQEALKTFERVVEMNPSEALPWTIMGRVFGQLGKTKKELEYYERALKIDPQSAGAWYSKGWALHYLKRYNEARSCWERAAALGSAEAKRALQILENEGR